MKKTYFSWLALIFTLVSSSGLADGPQARDITPLVELASHGFGCWKPEHYGRGNDWISVGVVFRNPVFFPGNVHLQGSFSSTEQGSVVIFKNVGNPQLHRGQPFDRLLFEITEGDSNIHLYRDDPENGRELNFLAFTGDYTEGKSFEAKYFFRWDHWIRHGWDTKLICEKLDGRMAWDRQTETIVIVPERTDSLK